MKITATQTRIRPIKAGDPEFNIVDGLVVTPRAGFEISNSCPNQYARIIAQCIEMRWLKPVAYVKDNELFWERLEK